MKTFMRLSGNKETPPRGSSMMASMTVPSHATTPKCFRPAMAACRFGKFACVVFVVSIPKIPCVYG